jgi:hypothetical protein
MRKHASAITIVATFSLLAGSGVASADAFSEMVVVEAVDPSELTVETSSDLLEDDELYGVNAEDLGSYDDGHSHNESPNRDASDGAEDPGDSTRRDRSLSCKQRIRQIVLLDKQAALAKDQGKRTWEDATWLRIAHRERKLQERCPEFYARRVSLQRLARFARQSRLAVRVAGEAAKRFFTGGLMPPGL